MVEVESRGVLGMVAPSARLVRCSLSVLTGLLISLHSHPTITMLSESHTPEDFAPLPSSRLDSLETTVHNWDDSSPLGSCDASEDPEVAFRHSGWQKRRFRVAHALQRIDPGSTRRARFATCGSHAWILQSDEDPDRYKVACSKCHDRLCIPCARERGRRVAARVARLSKDKSIRFVTLTLRINHEPLGDQVTRLIRCFARLRRRKCWSSTQTGGVAFLELKRRPGSHTWHPHVHIITEGVDIRKAVLSDAWLEITGDSFIVDIRDCKGDGTAAWYAAKYSGKAVHNGVESDPDMLEEAIVALKGRRLHTCFGNWSLSDADDELPAGGWHGIATLRSILDGCLAGDLASRRIVGLLNGESECDTEPRSPPDPGESVSLFDLSLGVPAVPSTCNLAL